MSLIVVVSEAGPTDILPVILSTAHVHQLVFKGNALKSFAYTFATVYKHPAAEEFICRSKAIVGYRAMAANSDDPDYIGLAGGRVWMRVH